MKLHHMPRTRSARVLSTAREVGVAGEIEVVPLNLQRGERRFPEYIESGAISLHLALRHSPNSKFLPDLATLQGAKV